MSKRSTRRSAGLAGASGQRGSDASLKVMLRATGLTEEPHSIFDLPLTYLNEQLDEDDHPVNMRLLDEYFNVMRSDTALRAAFDKMYNAVTQYGLTVQDDAGRTYDIRPEFHKSLRENYLSQLYNSLYLYTTTGFFVFCLKLHEAGDQVIPYYPEWGTYLLTWAYSDRNYTGRGRSYSLWWLDRKTGKLWRDPSAHVRKLYGISNARPDIEDSIVHTCLTNRWTRNLLVDLDLEATRKLSNPTMVREFLPQKNDARSRQQANADDEREREFNQLAYERHYKAVLAESDVQRIQDQENFLREQARLNAQAKLDEERMMLNQQLASGDVCDPRSAYDGCTEPTQSRWNQLGLPPGMRLVHQVVPVRRTDLLQYVSTLNNEAIERLGQPNVERYVTDTGKVLKNTTQLIDKELHDALKPWARVASDMLTAYYEAIFSDVDLFQKLVKLYSSKMVQAASVQFNRSGGRRVNPRPGDKAWGKGESKGAAQAAKRKRGDTAADGGGYEAKIEIRLSYLDTIPESTLTDLYERGLMKREDYLEERLLTSNVCDKKIKYLLKNIPPPPPDPQAQASPAGAKKPSGGGASSDKQKKAKAADGGKGKKDGKGTTGAAKKTTKTASGASGGDGKKKDKGKPKTSSASLRNPEARAEHRHISHDHHHHGEDDAAEPEETAVVEVEDTADDGTMDL